MLLTVKVTASSVSREDSAKEETKDSSSSQASHDRLLKGVMRVGLLAKGLLLKDDKEVCIIFRNLRSILTFFISG